MRHKLELLQDVQATLDSAIRIRQEIQVFFIFFFPKKKIFELHDMTLRHITV